MRKYRLLASVVLSLVVVSALSIGAMGAPLQLDVSGSLETELAIVQKVGGGFDLLGRGGVRLQLGSVLTSQDGTIRGVINLRSAEVGGIGDFADLDTFGSSIINLYVDSAYLEAEGPWWVGGPSVITRIGRHNVSYSDWVAHRVGHNGIGISGLQLGQLAIDAYAGWTEDDRPVALRARADLDVFEVDTTFVDRRAGSGRVTDLVAHLNIDLLEDVRLLATVARDGEHEVFAYRGEANLGPFSGVDVDFAVWSTPEEFAPRYANYGAENPVFTADSRGVKVGASTVWSGIQLRGAVSDLGRVSDPNWKQRIYSVDGETNLEGFDVSFGFAHENLNGVTARTIEVGVARELAGILLGYTGKLRSGEPLESVVTASTTRNLPIFGDVDLSGRVRVKSGTDTQVDASAKWQAPNGINLGLHYANYELTGIRPGNADGFYATAGYVLQF